jgi:hypothetical protein
VSLTTVHHLSMSSRRGSFLPLAGYETGTVYPFTFTSLRSNEDYTVDWGDDSETVFTSGATGDSVFPVTAWERDDDDVATVTVPGHRFEEGDDILVYGVDEDLDGEYEITEIDGNDISFVSVGDEQVLTATEGFATATFKEYAVADDYEITVTEDSTGVVVITATITVSAPD